MKIIIIASQDGVDFVQALQGSGTDAEMVLETPEVLGALINHFGESIGDGSYFSDAKNVQLSEVEACLSDVYMDYDHPMITIHEIESPEPLIKGSFIGNDGCTFDIKM